MAVSVNTVYQRVLAIANKEQRGYITPQEFEQYFYDINQFNRLPGNSTEYSDMLHVLEEKIAPFRVNGSSLTAASVKFEDTFEADITDWSEVVVGNGVISHEAPSSTNSYNGGLKILQDANGAVHIAESDTNFALVAGTRYTITWEIIAMDEPTSYTVYVDDAGTASHHMVIAEPAVGTVSFTFIADTSGNHNIRIENGDTTNNSKYITVGNISVKEIDNTSLPANLYRLGEVFYKASGASFATPIAELNSNEATIYNLSPLGKPTTSNPAYVRSGSSSITIYPTVLGTGSTVTCNYIKKPTDASWGYNVVLQKAVYNASTSTDFELHPSEESTLVNKILLLAGVVIDKPGLTGVAGTMVNEEKQQEKL